MNETLKIIMERYSCRDFTGAPPTDAEISALVDAALASPSGMNRQPWHIIVVNDKGLIDELDVEAMGILAAAEDKSGYERIKSRGGKVYYNAPCMLLVTSDDSGFAPMDCGILSQNVALAAASLGLGSVICGMAGIPLSGPRADELKKRLKFPDGYRFAISILVGVAKSGKAPHELDKGKVTYI
ncbi:MAG: nitroreductase family protein [Treponema sp.]|jgi:nitroreductase|nr:nitroreductase family protein [Treponema sp.]